MRSAKDARDASLFYRVFMGGIYLLFRLLTRLHVTGSEHIPLTGPVIVSPNHLHSLDIPLVGMLIPRRTVIFAADKWQRTLRGRIMHHVTRVIYVARGEADRDALAEALQVLKAGGTMAVAPEGTRSRTGGLQQGKHGAVYLASRSGATIIPVAAWGHERALAELRRLRRADVYVVIGPPWPLPPGAERARTAELHACTDDLMMTLARMLPEQYRGVYTERAAESG